MIVQGLLQLLLLSLPYLSTVKSQAIVNVRYGYFAEARPMHAACGRGWFDLALPDVIYNVTCYPQASGNFASSRIDNGQLDIAALGSTPLAQALARGVDLQVLYISHYMGDSQGIYVQASDPSINYTGILNPFDLVDKSIGVPFGSTIHYQVLFLLDLLGLKGRVNLMNLSPSAIINKWNKRKIDAAACWGAAREHVLAGTTTVLPAETLITAQTLSNWGASTFVVVTGRRSFIEHHPEFVAHLTGILSRINDSFLDRLGENDISNVQRWDSQESAPISLLPSMVDALMLQGETPAEPSKEILNSQRRVLDLFEQISAADQLSCEYMGHSPSPCVLPSLPHVALQQTAKFLLDQKEIATLGQLEILGEETKCSDINTLCGSDLFDGGYLSSGLEDCGICHPAGPYSANGTMARTDMLIEMLEDLDASTLRPPFAYNEIGRPPSNSNITGDSTCGNHTIIDKSSPLRGTLGDGANGGDGKSYSDSLHCLWEIRGQESAGNVVELSFKTIKLWSGDTVRVYANPSTLVCKPGDTRNILVGQFTGFYDDHQLPLVRGYGCLLVELATDSNMERSYGGLGLGDGISFEFNRAIAKIPACNGFSYDETTKSCQCDGLHWGADCSFTDFCFGTSRIELPETNEYKHFATSGDLNVIYPNDLDCWFEIRATNGEKFVEITVNYDLEQTHDLLWLQTSSVGSSEGSGPYPYMVLTGKSESAEIYLVPTDEFGYVTFRVTTDARGRRQGLTAMVRAVDEEISMITSSGPCSEPGKSGADCRVEHCIAENRLQTAGPLTQDVAPSHVLGRAVSQVIDQFALPMPWAKDGGCVWPLGKAQNAKISSVEAVRLVFNSPLDLESHPAAAVGDKLLIRQRNDAVGDFALFLEKCISGEVCTASWQTGECSVDGFCVVRNVVEAPMTATSEATLRLVTDRSDGGGLHKGFDVDILVVEKCPTEVGLKHCEAGAGHCVNGFCLCSGNIPCSCPCKGEAPKTVSSSGKIGIAVGVLAALLLVLITYFFHYRHKKRLKFAALERELETFRMRTAINEYIPKIRENRERYKIPATRREEAPKAAVAPPIVQWYWEESPSCMHQHDPNTLLDPNECFIKYSDECNQKLEAAYQKRGSDEKCVPMKGYSVDFSSMEQTKLSTGFVRNVKRVATAIPSADTADSQTVSPEVDLDQVVFGDDLPEDLEGEPQVVLVKGDLIQISKQREDGWAFGSKLHHANEALSRKLVQIATHGYSTDEEGAEDDDSENVLTDTGWFQLSATSLPTTDDLHALSNTVGDAGALASPENWDPVNDPTVVEQHELLPDCQEYKDVVSTFMSSLDSGVKVVKVHRIQNLAMWQSYVVKRQTICYRETSSSGDQSDEARQRALERFERCWLWHGTNIDVLSKILQQGFNRSFCGKNATAFGKGVYFARDARYSADRMYSVPDGKGFQYILACRVVVGEYCFGKFNALTPEVRDKKTNSLYDSTVNDTQNPTIYVTYHDAQAYPEYLIQFKKKW